MIIANKYKILEKIGKGGFGTIFKGENIRTKELVAIKMEPINAETKMLKREAQIYQYLSKSEGIPEIKWYGIIDNYYYMVIPLLGVSFSNILANGKTFSLKEVFSIGKELIKRLKYIHEKGLIHRDIKTDNILLSLCGKKIYLIDFGLCRKYKDNSNNHIVMKSEKSIIGTPNFISTNIHNGLEPSRRDDLESIAYILINLQLGKLEWGEKTDLNKIKMIKLSIHNNILVNDKLVFFLNYCRNMQFCETPNYEYLINLLN